MAGRLPRRRHIVRMNDTQRRRVVWGGDIVESGTGYLGESLVDVSRRSFRRCAPDHGGYGVDKLLKLTLAPPKRFLGVHLIVYVVAEAVPLDDTPILIPHWPGAARHPALHANGAGPAIPHGQTPAGAEEQGEGV